jgi:hypothetical protein
MPEQQPIEELLVDDPADSHAVRLLRRILEVERDRLEVEREERHLLKRIDRTLHTFLQDWLGTNNPYAHQAVTGRLSQGETPMSLTVDAAGNAHFQFEDDKGDIAAAPTGDGSGITVTFASDNPAVVSAYAAATEAPDANGNPEYTAAPTVVADGTFNLSAAVANTSGAPLLDDDGVTPFTQPAPVAVTLTAGQATTGVVSES